MAVKQVLFEQALSGLADLLAVDADEINALPPVLSDAVRNGLAQKFEYCNELCWKTLKEVLRDQYALEALSPKSAIKLAWQQNLLDESTYLSLFEAIDNRNMLSHVYSQDDFEAALNKIPKYFAAMQNVVKVLKGLQ